MICINGFDYVLFIHKDCYKTGDYTIGSYREIAIAIESEAGDSLT